VSEPVKGPSAAEVEARMTVAREAAWAGARVILAASEQVRGHGGDAAALDVGEKSVPGDYVTEVDLASEAAIREVLAAATPGVPVFGEEGATGRSFEMVLAGRWWIVDPLDGTTNFLHDFPAVGVSVALVEEGSPVAGAIVAPFLGEAVVAGRGLGTWRERPSRGPTELTPGRPNGRERMFVSDRTADRAVVATGFPFRRKETLLDRYLRAFGEALATFEDLRRPGAASLDLAWVATGVLDGFFELALSPWDVAAGALAIREAGGVVTDWRGDERGWLLGDILAGPPAVHRELLRISGGR
jgi:myo-inositol-1(or 4)-monophosphatase